MPDQSLSRARTLSLSLAILVFASLTAGAAERLFPQPLHLSRVVETPFGKQLIEEYCHGNQIVTVMDQTTVIVDYEKQTVTEISRAAGTYSVTSFSDVARASAGQSTSGTAAASKLSGSASQWELRQTSVPAGRQRGQYYEVEPKQHRQIRKMEVGVDRGVMLSREAVEALTGAAYPNAPSDEADITIRAAGQREGGRGVRTQGSGASEVEGHALPLEQTITYDAGNGKQFTVSNRVTRVGSEPAPATLTTIPPGARAVESHFLRIRRELEELDKLNPNQ